MAHHLAVGGRRALHAPVAAGVGGADARVAARRPGTPAPSSSDSSPSTPAPATHHQSSAAHVDQVTVVDGAVGRRPHRLAVELHLLLGVPQLQSAGALVGGRLLAVRQGDGGRQVDLVLQVGVGGLEAAEAVALHEGGGVEAVPSLGGV